MVSKPADDLKDIDKSLSYREMFKQILNMIKDDRKDRASDRGLLEKFITTQQAFNDKIDVRVRALEDSMIETNLNLKILNKESKKWDITNTIIAAAAAIAAAIGITGS